MQILPRRQIQIEPLEHRLLLVGDLTVTIFEVPEQFLYTGHPHGRVFDLRAFVKGISSVTVEIVEVAVIFSKDQTIGNTDDFVGRAFYSYLPQFNAIEIDGGQCAEETTAGRYYVAVKIDSPNEVTESNEGNTVIITSEPVVTVVTRSWPWGGIYGTAGDDVISMFEHRPRPQFELDFKDIGTLFVTINGVTRAVGEIEPEEVFIDAGSGNDKVIAEFIDTRLLITGSGGNDTILGGRGNDELSGANGKDKVFGFYGNDYLLGGAQNDYLHGDTGDDTLSGAGGNDILYGREGNDYLIGGGGNDLFMTRDISADTLSGGAGLDRAQIDEFDTNRSSIEELLA